MAETMQEPSPTMSEHRDGLSDVHIGKTMQQHARGKHSNTWLFTRLFGYIYYCCAGLKSQVWGTS